MARRRGIKGEITQGERHEWEPLVNAVGERVAGDFMWMYEVELSDGRSLQAYKHVDTRCYVHLASDGEAYYYYGSSDHYVPIPAWRIFSAVFRDLRGLGGVTEGQVLDSHAAVDRLYEGESEEASGGDTPSDRDSPSNRDTPGGVYAEVYADQHRDR